ncbi:MAG: hypothetical protein IPP74_15080 [Alphaproteobacteria bacterium]|nr:hypothetical protein [Alphaproteobacteria bacterium]
MNIQHLYSKMIRLITINKKVKDGDVIATLFAIKSYEAQDRMINETTDFKIYGGTYSSGNGE